MPYFLARGRRVALIHGFRNRQGEVRHRRLHEFLTRADLAAALIPAAWPEFEKTMTAKHPDLSFDWPRLRQQAERLTDQVPPPAARDTDAHTLELRKLIGALRRRLDGMYPGSSAEDRAVFLGAAYDLRELLYFESVRLNGTLHPDERGNFETNDMLRTFYFRDRDGVGVDQAQALFRAGRRQDAEKAFEQARRDDPLDPDVLNSEGICWLEEEDFARAEALFRQASDLARHRLPLKRRILEWGSLEARPYLRARFNLGLALEKQKRLDEAAAVWEDLLAIFPENNFYLCYHLAAIYHRQGRLDEAVSSYERDLFLPDAQYGLAGALLAKCADEDGLMRLLSAFPENLYVPSLLLGERPLPHRQVFDVSNLEGPECARDYAEEAGDLWSERALQLMGLLWHQPEVQEAIQELRVLKRGLKIEKVGERRHELSAAMVSRSERLLPAKEARELVARVAAAAPPPSASGRQGIATRSRRSPRKRG